MMVSFSGPHCLYYKARPRKRYEKVTRLPNACSCKKEHFNQVKKPQSKGFFINRTDLEESPWNTPDWCGLAQPANMKTPIKNEIPPSKASYVAHLSCTSTP